MAIQELARYLVGPQQKPTSVGANRGRQLDPTGYVQREIDNRLNRNADSDNRSGLAQNMLQRQEEGGASVYDYSSRPSGMLPSTTFNRSAIDELTPIFPADAPVAATMPGFSGSALPLDQQFLADQMGIQNNWSTMAQNLLDARQQAETAFTKSFRNLEEGNKTDPYKILDQYAGRGMGMSSGMVNAMGDYTRKYNTAMNELTADRTKAATTYSGGIGRMQDDYYRSLAAALSGLGGRLSEQAGDLGLTIGPKASYIPDATLSPVSAVDKLIAQIAADVKARAEAAKR